MKVAMAALLLGIAMTAACATDPVPAKAPAAGQRISLLPGQSARLADGSQLHFSGVVSDSRCPLDVQCIWAGDAELALQWRRVGASPIAITLHTNPSVGPDHAQLGDGRLVLLELARQQPLATMQITPNP